MASDLKPPSVNNGTLSEGGRSLFASESSLRAARLQCGSQVPAEYFALSVEATALLFLFPLTLSNMTQFLIAKCQQCLKRRGRRRGDVRWLFIFSFWRLVWLSSACLKGWQLRIRVYREWKGEEADRETKRKREKKGGEVEGWSRNG